MLTIPLKGRGYAKFLFACNWLDKSFSLRLVSLMPHFYGSHFYDLFYGKRLHTPTEICNFFLHHKHKEGACYLSSLLGDILMAGSKYGHQWILQNISKERGRRLLNEHNTLHSQNFIKGLLIKYYTLKLIQFISLSYVWAFTCFYTHFLNISTLRCN